MHFFFFSLHQEHLVWNRSSEKAIWCSSWCHVIFSSQDETWNQTSRLVMTRKRWKTSCYDTSRRDRTHLVSSCPHISSCFQSWCDATSLTTTRNMKWHDMLWFGYKMTLITLLFFFCPVMTLNYSYWLLSVLIWWLLCLVITFLFQDSVFFDIKFMLVVMVSLWLNIWYCLPTTLLWHFFSCLLITQDFFNCLDIFSFVFSNMTLKH